MALYPGQYPLQPRYTNTDKYIADPIHVWPNPIRDYNGIINDPQYSLAYKCNEIIFDKQKGEPVTKPLRHANREKASIESDGRSMNSDKITDLILGSKDVLAGDKPGILDDVFEPRPKRELNAAKGITKAKRDHYPESKNPEIREDRRKERLSKKWFQMRKDRVVQAARYHRLKKDYDAVNERWAEAASDVIGYKSKLGRSLENNEKLRKQNQELL